MRNDAKQSNSLMKRIKIEIPGKEDEDEEIPDN